MSDGVHKVNGERGAVASPEPLATQVGIDILNRGGEAVDAAIAVAFALAVTYPAAGNIGGGGFLICRSPQGVAHAVDYRETAPRLATRDMYLDSNGDVIRGNNGPVDGFRACGVPGTVAGMHTAFQKFGSGKVKWCDLVQPAVDLARSGFFISYGLTQSIAQAKDRLALNDVCESLFLESKPWSHDFQARRPGQLLRQEVLAQTLVRVRDYGAQDFYMGKTARLLSQDIKNNKGVIDATDLASYTAKVRRPLEGVFAGNSVITMPPPSSGGIAILQMLGILGCLSELPEPGTANYVHVLVQIMRKAFRDRSEYIGDPDFIRVPIKELLSRQHVISMVKGIGKQTPVRFDDLKQFQPLPYESEETTHFSVVDEYGGCVSNTYTLNSAYGAAVMSESTGILLNNEMDDFTSKVGTANQFGLIQGAQNSIVSGKRPLSSMTPTIIVDKVGNILLATGSPGGPTIINTVLHTVLQRVLYRSPLELAVAAPRFHHQWKPDIVYLESTLNHVVPELNYMGYKTEIKKLGDVHAIAWDRSTGASASSDLRGDGLALAQ